MAKTPSKGLDQNASNKFIDKYWGRVPQFLKLIPEAYICEVNPEYLQIMQGYIDGDITKANLGDELYHEIENIVLNVGCPCLLDNLDRAIMNAFLGDEPCPVPSHKLTCYDPLEPTVHFSICCNTILRCESLTICDDGGTE